MNGSKAKAIRRCVYGEQSLRQKRRYVRLNNQRDRKTGDMVPGTILNAPDSLRARYQAAKRTANAPSHLHDRSAAEGM